jgi:hypothetical protein
MEKDRGERGVGIEKGNLAGNTVKKNMGKGFWLQKG